MKKIILLVFLLVPVQGFCNIYVPTFRNGNGLLKECEAYIRGNAVEGNACAGYIMGVVDTNDFFVAWGLIQSQWCLPDGMSIRQLVPVVTKYLKEEDPAKLSQNAASKVGIALKRTFPCQ